MPSVVRDYVLGGVITPLYVQGYDKRNGTRLGVVVATVPLNSILKRYGTCPFLSHPILKQSRAPHTVLAFGLAAYSLTNGDAGPRHWITKPNPRAGVRHMRRKIALIGYKRTQDP